MKEIALKKPTAGWLKPACEHMEEILNQQAKDEENEKKITVSESEY